MTIIAVLFLLFGASAKVPKLYFVTFGDGGPRKEAAQNLANQVRAHFGDIFTEAYAFNFSVIDAKWKKDYKHLLTHRRGLGYWAWKWQVGLQMFRDVMEDGDVLHYCDSDMHVRPTGAETIYKYLFVLRKSNYDILSFQMHWIEQEWDKGDLLDRLGIRNRTDFLTSGQYVGGFWYIRKTRQAEKLFKDSLALANESNNHYITDSTSRSPNPPRFQEHRHDQSIFSLLRKINGSAVLPDPTTLCQQLNQNNPPLCLCA
eukprot:gb/GEZN01014275.1/.p1 GENE.gb/GEZN01014275.1/~~gb/GEZN01014275.1/.p1  ORF type:complete len:258 (+),score=13.97 gb/GEZN01014275.1/:44-817(+)